MNIWPTERTLELIKLRDDGLSYTQIADRLNVPRGAVAGKLARIDGRVLPRHKQKSRKTGLTRLAPPNSWDHRLFEPWAEYTARKKLERQRAAS